MLRQIFESKDYRDMCARTGSPVYVFTKELEVDMYRLAGFGTPEEVIAAYYRNKWRIKES